MSDVLFPAGRMIGGSVYEAYPEIDNFGKPKLGTDGQPITSFSFGLAIPKGSEQHWSQTPWGQQVLAIGANAHPKNYQLATYAWKIKDGDSAEPNKNGKIPRDIEGYRGCWIIWFKQRWAPKLVTDKGTTQLVEPNQIVPGYYIEVLADVAGNTGPSPGVYINPKAVNRVAFGEVIQTQANVDTTNVGFGQSALPAGASMVPVGGGFSMPQMSAPALLQPQASAIGLVQPPVSTVQPNHAILTLPPVPGAPVAPPIPPAAPVRQMTAAAQGASYEQMIQAGWTHDLLIQHGMMTA